MKYKNALPAGGQEKQYRKIYNFKTKPRNKVLKLSLKTFLILSYSFYFFTLHFSFTC